ncbi:MAG: Cna B-type domain-containing protein [Firmicutes bacterium]|nr:Cna B-type domain-containing protein [Bacillota bacterium]
MNLHKPATVTISYWENDEALVGAAFDLYHIADMDENGRLIIRTPYVDYPVNLNSETATERRGTATALQGYILRDGLMQDSHKQTDQDGRCTFDSLTCGAYLIIGYRHIQGELVYQCEPILMTVPAYDSSSKAYQYELVVKPKKEVEMLPENPNPIYESYKVLKIWKDGEGENRPREIKVDLLKDGKVYDTVKLNEDDQWKHIWEKLPTNHSWNVVEREVSSYTATVTKEGHTFIITNTKKGSISEEEGPTTPSTPGEEPDDYLPLTGQLWPVALIMFAIGLAFVVVGLLVKRRADYEG